MPEIQGTTFEGPSLSSRVLIRALDLLLALVALVLLAPVMLLTALVVLVTMGNPIFFRQLRAGRHNRPFHIIKFRSMREGVDSHGNVLPDHQRLTTFGRFLRKSSLDELPQLMNVLSGQMSLVGPRPLFLEYFDYYSERERHRLDVRPGITGLAQVSGRNFAGWNRKLEMDALYVEQFGIGLYVKVLLLTIFNVFDWRQVSADPYAAEQALNVERAETRRQDSGAND